MSEDIQEWEEQEAGGQNKNGAASSQDARPQEGHDPEFEALLEYLQG